MSTKWKTVCKALRENKNEYIPKCGGMSLRRPMEIIIQIIRIQSSVIKVPYIQVCVYKISQKC